MSREDIQALQKGFKSFREFILELCYPNTCVLCGTLSHQGMCLCCERDYPIDLENRCMCCSKFIRDNTKEYCNDCLGVKKYFTQGGALWIHKGKVQDSIYRYKYKNHRIYAETYAHLLLDTYGEKLLEWKPQAIMGVPVHKSRLRNRGYNQAEILSQCLASNIERKYNVLLAELSNCAHRHKRTTVQKKLDDRERVRNIKGAFGLCDTRDWPKSVLIIDDIYTTGSTLNEMAKLLKKRGVKQVYFLTISIGQGF